jgi:hypothetical protein
LHPARIGLRSIEAHLAGNPTHKINSRGPALRPRPLTC